MVPLFEGMIGAVAPFEDGLDPLGFSKNASEMDLKRYREAELTHGRVAMLASLGFLVGEQVEGSSFLFDAQVTGPAINHFQQVPEKFWVGLLAFVSLCETTRVQRGWAYPGLADKVVFRESATPATQTRYTRAAGGTGYGLAATPEQFMDKRPGSRGPIPGPGPRARAQGLGLGPKLRVLAQGLGPGPLAQG